MSPEGHREMIVLIVRFIVITLAVALRFVGKFTREQKNRFWWDDLWILVAWCFNFAAEALTVWGKCRCSFVPVPAITYNS